MPNAKVLSEKQAIVAALTERLKKSSSGVIVDYRGITVDEDTALRTEMRKNGVDYTVLKNTLLKFAVNGLGMEGLDSALSGTTSLATTDGDPIAPFRIISDYSKKLNDRFNIKAAFMDGQVLESYEIEELASLPSKEALLSVVLGTMLAPITSLAVVLDQIAKKNGEAVPAEAPAAE
jgi:large subunit ribosomal protein L10